MPAGVLLVVKPLPTPRSVGTGPTPTRTGLLRHGYTAGHTAIVAGLRRHARSTLATTGPLDHTGSAVRHRTSSSGDRRGAGSLPAGNDRRNRGGGPHRPSVAGSDSSGTGNLRRSGEPAGLRLVRVHTLMGVPPAAGLTPGDCVTGLSVGTSTRATVAGRTGVGLISTADHTVRARVTSGPDESVRAGVRTRLDESVGAGVRTRLDESVRAGVRTRLDEGMGPAVAAQSAVGGAVAAGTLITGNRRRGMPRAMTEIAFRSGTTRTAALRSTGLLRPAPTAPARALRTRSGHHSRTVGSGGATAGARPVPVRDCPGLMNGLIATRNRTGLMHRVATTRDRTRLMDRVVTAGNRAGLIRRITATRIRAGCRNGVGAARGNRIRRAETITSRCGRRHGPDTGPGPAGAGRHRADARRHRTDAGWYTTAGLRSGSSTRELGGVAGERNARRGLPGEHLPGLVRVELPTTATGLRATALRRSGSARGGRRLTRAGAW